MPELIAAYPDAKVIVAMRDPDAWWKSVEHSVGREHRTLNGLSSITRNLLMKFDPYIPGEVFPSSESVGLWAVWQEGVPGPGEL